MSKAERVEDVRESVLIDRPPSPFAEHRPPLFTRDFILLCLIALGYFFSFFFFFPTLPFYIKHLGRREADVGLLMGRIATHVGFTPMYLCGSGCVGVALAIFLWGNRAVRQ